MSNKEFEEDREISDRLQTNRQKIYYITQELFMYCRQDHERTHKLADLLLMFVKEDEEMSEFLNKCMSEDYDPRSNYLFYSSTEEGTKWPSIKITTEDDKNTELVKEINEFITHIPFMKKYLQYL